MEAGSLDQTRVDVGRVFRPGTRVDARASPRGGPSSAMRRKSLAVTMAVLFPIAEQTAQHNQFPEMVRRVVRDEQQLAQVCLSAAVRNAGEQVDLWIGGEIPQPLAIRLELTDALVPCLR